MDARQQNIVENFKLFNPETEDDDFILRMDGKTIEWIDPKSGIGHPICGYMIHGCDGGCSKKILPQMGGE